MFLDRTDFTAGYLKIPPKSKHFLATLFISQKKTFTFGNLYIRMHVSSVVRCSMALLHSRVRRVFYGTDNSSIGGLGSVYKIHCQKGLNHHFDVFKGVCLDKCSELNNT